MDSVEWLEYPIYEGQGLIERLVSEGFPIDGACWIKAADRDRWEFYIASSLMDQDKKTPAFSKLSAALQSLGNRWVTSMKISLVGSKHELTQAANDLLRNYTHKKPIKPPEFLNCGISVEQLYVYATGKTDVTIYGVGYPGIPQVAGSPSFDPEVLDSRFRIEIENHGNIKKYEGKTGIAGVVAAPNNARLARTGMGELQLSGTSAEPR